MTLQEHLASQGIFGDLAAELLERKQKAPSLTGVVAGGQWVSLSPPTTESTARFNEMVASGQAPQANTDNTFMVNTANGRQFQNTPHVGDYYRKVTERRGGSVTGKKYLTQLARFPGDPEAWVSGRGDVQRVLEQRGWGSTGAVNVQGRAQDEEPKPVDVADDIVEREVNKVIGPEPVTPKKRKRVKEDVRARLKPSWKK